MNMKTKRTRLRSRVIPAIASALMMAFPAWAQNLTLDQTKSVNGHYSSGGVTYNYSMAVTFDGPGFVTTSADGQLSVAVNATMNQTGFLLNSAGRSVEVFGSGGRVGVLQVGLKPYVSPITVDDTNDSFRVAGYTDTADDGFKNYGSISPSVEGVAYTPPANGAPISLQNAGSSPTPDEIDVVDTANLPSVLSLTPDGLFKDGGNFQLSGIDVQEGSGGTADIGTCSMDMTMHYGVYAFDPYLGVIGTVNEFGSKSVSLKVQYVRGDHLFKPVVTATASPSPLIIGTGGTNVEMITVQIYNPSPDLTTTNGTLDFTGIGLNSAIPNPTQIPNITIAPRSTVTETFQIVPQLNGEYNFNPQIEFTTGWQYPVPAANTYGPYYANAHFTVTPPNDAVTVETQPVGLTFTVDGVNYSYGKVFSWPESSSHTISAHASQNGGPGVQYTWSYWNDFLPVSHTVVVPASTIPTTYTATFNTEYFLTMNAGTGGSVSPGSEWTNASAPVLITATPNSGYRFRGWTGSGDGSFTGTNNSWFINMDNPITETADFIAIALPSFSFASVTGNEFQATLSGLSTGEQVVLESSTDLKNWIPVQTNKADGQSLTFTNTINPALMGQYFRATVN
jgi:hypothetical protein